MSQTIKSPYSRNESLSLEGGTNFINNNKATDDMKNAANAPLLYVDDSEDSKKAKTDLDKAKRYYLIQKVRSDYERKNLNPPILFTPEGTFKGYFEINSFAFSIFWAKKKS